MNPVPSPADAACRTAPPKKASNGSAATRCTTSVCTVTTDGRDARDGVGDGGAARGGRCGAARAESARACDLARPDSDGARCTRPSDARARRGARRARISRRGHARRSRATSPRNWSTPRSVSGWTSSARHSSLRDGDGVGAGTAQAPNCVGDAAFTAMTSHSASELSKARADVAHDADAVMPGRIELVERGDDARRAGARGEQRLRGVEDVRGRDANAVGVQARMAPSVSSTSGTGRRSGRRASRARGRRDRRRRRRSRLHGREDRAVRRAGRARAGARAHRRLTRRRAAPAW